MASPAGLFGGGCVVENERLILTAAFYKEGGTPVLARNSYHIDLASPLTIPSDGRLPWQTTERLRKIPGDFVKVLASEKLFYIAGRSGRKNWLIGRRGNSDSPLSETTLAMPLYGAGPFVGPTLSSETRYLDALNQGLGVAFSFEDYVYLLENTHNPEHPLYSIFRELNEDVTTIATDKTPPPYLPGYSATQFGTTVYVATEGHIHALDLKSLRWEAHPVAGFRAAQSGCLAVHNGTLIHAFGRDGDEYLNRTQFIDMNTWALKHSLAMQVSPSPPVTIVTVSLFIVLLLAMGAACYIFRKRAPPALVAPEFYTQAVWAEPQEPDWSLSTAPEISMDLTPDATPFTTGGRFSDPPSSPSPAPDDGAGRN